MEGRGIGKAIEEEEDRKEERRSIIANFSLKLIQSWKIQ